MCGDGVEREALGDLRRRQGTFHVLFVGQNKDGRLLQVLKIQPGGDARDAPHMIHANRKRQKFPQNTLSGIFEHAVVKLPPSVTGVHHMSVPSDVYMTRSL